MLLECLYALQQVKRENELPKERVLFVHHTPKTKQKKNSKASEICSCLVCLRAQHFKTAKTKKSWIYCFDMQMTVTLAFWFCLFFKAEGGHLL